YSSLQCTRAPCFPYTTLFRSVRAMVVPGSQNIKHAAEAEGLDRVFLEAGFEWRESGCSMCLGMNPDILQPGERCASTSNRNFEGDRKSTHLNSSHQIIYYADV